MVGSFVGHRRLLPVRLPVCLRRHVLNVKNNDITTTGVNRHETDNVKYNLKQNEGLHSTIRRLLTDLKAQALDVKDSENFKHL